eukprot:tig00000076_g2397.t1
MSNRFSSGVRLTDLDDFITPSQSCVVGALPDLSNKTERLPMQGGAHAADGTKAAKLSLNDCLACSGCVTTAEAVLIGEQSTKEMLDAFTSGQKVNVVSISIPAHSSICAHYGLNAVEGLAKLVTLFKSIGAHFVYDCTLASAFSLIELNAEFQARLAEREAGRPAALPIITSSCPGWICYAEKTHGSYVLPYISSVKSPQQIMGTLVKQFLSQKLGKKPDEIYHVTVMPCYDKKLEASRDDFMNQEKTTKDVDCVVTSIEIEELLSERNIDLKSLPPSPPDPEFTLAHVSPDVLFRPAGFGAGGYLQSTMRTLASAVARPEAELQPLKNQDMREASLDIDSQRSIKFAMAYGFKNIQNVVRRVKQKSCPYDFIEIMACPGGCLNGGGQIRPEGTEARNQLLAKARDVHEQRAEQDLTRDPHVLQMHDQLFGQPFSEKARALLHTQYHERPKLASSMLKW